jgi:nitrate/TMAO reductase-like tetraheme cytochrome c subunit
MRIPMMKGSRMAMHEGLNIRFLKLLGYFSLLIVVFILFSLPTRLVGAETKKQETEHYCLSCHSNPDLSMELPDGETLSLFISPETIENSTHSQEGIECEACHTEIKGYPHPEIEYQSKRELSRAYYLSCRKCHSANYEKTLDSIHAKAAEAGNLDAPVCTDCHGAHSIQAFDQPRAIVSKTCGRCHEDVFDQYIESIHGGALIGENNPDVPLCTDCHGVHNIQDPGSPQFHSSTPDLCAGCHADPELMQKYGLSSNVYNLYELSWHGVDVSVYKAMWPTIRHESAVCTDCHGIHNIRSAQDPKSMVYPDNLLQTCQKCHKDASPNWTSAWTGHNEISLERTPYLFYVKQFYITFSRLVLWLSIAYVGLQLLRSIVNRVRRSIA